MKNIEIKTIEYKGIEVTVQIDFDQGKISLVERDNGIQSYHTKYWLFAERGLEYMQGWQNILDAMKYAIKEAEKDLRAFQKEKEDLVTELIEAGQKELDKKNKKK